MADLWPENLDLKGIRTPVGLLKEQAINLGKRTQNIIVAEVQAVTSVPKLFHYIFYLVAPALGNYHYDLFSISYNEALYPVGFRLDEDLKKEISIVINKKKSLGGKKVDKSEALDFQVKDEKEFLEVLKAIFNADRTKRLIQSLYAQSESMKQSA